MTVENELLITILRKIVHSNRNSIKILHFNNTKPGDDITDAATKRPITFIPSIFIRAFRSFKCLIKWRQCYSVPSKSSSYVITFPPEKSQTYQKCSESGKSLRKINKQTRKKECDGNAYKRPPVFLCSNLFNENRPKKVQFLWFEKTNQISFVWHRAAVALRSFIFIFYFQM